MVQQLQVSQIDGRSVQLSAEPVRSFLGQKERSFWLENRQGLALQEGDWVEITFPSGRGLLDVFFLLMVPVLLVVGIAHLLPSSMPQAQQVIYSLLGLPIGIGFFVLSQKLLPAVQPEFVRVLSEAETLGRSQGCGSGCVCK